MKNSATASADRLLPGIHGLRAVAALMVLLFHLAPLSNLALPKGLEFIGTYFGLGVHLFFVLSAFSLCHSTLVNIDRPGWTRDYFIKRFFRIAPLFYVMLAAWYALFYARNAAPALGDVLLNLVFAFNFVPAKYASIVAAGWTVGVEMVFYVVFPVILLLVGRLRHAFIFFCLASLVSVIARMSLEESGGAYVDSAFISALGIFATGFLAFWLFRRIDGRAGGAIPENTGTWAVAIPVMAGFVIVSPVRHWLYPWGRADIVLFSVFFGGMAVWQALFPSRLLASRIMTFMGERSYSIYLLHPWIMFWLIPANQWLSAKLGIVIGSWAFLVNAAFTISVTVAASAITYRFIEKPGMEYGKRLIARLRCDNMEGFMNAFNCMIRRVFSSPFFSDYSYIRLVTANFRPIDYSWRDVILCLTTVILSITFFFLYYAPADLFDFLHYIASGVLMARDGESLIWPYSSMNPGGSWTAYGYFQENGKLIDLHKSYPSKLYSFLFSFYYWLTGEVNFAFSHIVSCTSIVTGNIFLFLSARRFFDRTTSFLFFLTVLLMPLTTSAFKQTDAIGYFFACFVLWVLVWQKYSSLLLGVMVGFFSHFRFQIIFFLATIPAFLYFVSDKANRYIIIFRVILSGILIFLIIGFLFRLLVPSSLNDNVELSFYWNHFFGQNIFLDFDYVAMLLRLLRNLVVLVRPDYFFIFLIVVFLLAFYFGDRLHKGLAVFAIIGISIPLLAYSFDRFSDPTPRYYVAFLPFIILNWFLIISMSVKSASGLRRYYVFFFTFCAVLPVWIIYSGLPFGNIFRYDVLSSRLYFLNFNGVQKIISENFSVNDLVIVNHSFPSAFTRLSYQIPLPSRNEFDSGTNSEIDGIIFSFHSFPESAIYSFFTPNDWMENGELPLEIVDRKNERFLKIADLSSELKDSTGQLHSAARFVIYRNANKNRKKQFDKYGQRIFSPRVYPELSTLRIEAPEFNNPNAWSDRLGCFVIKGRGEGVDVGPGYNNVNVLTQRFNVIPNEHLLISTRARSISGTAKGRIQVNWINEKEQFLSSEIAVFQVDTSDEDFQKSVTVPANAKWGIVYVTPHDQGGHLHYSFLRIMGYTLLK